MKKGKSLWDRVNENPILPGLLFGFWIWKMNQSNWNWGWWQIAGVGIVAVWFIWTLMDFLLGGKLTDWLDSESDSSFSIPDSFAEFEAKSKLSTPLIDALRDGLGDEGERDVALVKWTVDEDFGIGMTGGTATWCFFSTENQDELVIDIYSRHCNWEMRANEMEGAPEEYNELEFGKNLLRKANLEESWEPKT